MLAHNLTPRQLRLLDYLLHNLRRAPGSESALIERESSFLLGYVFALEIQEELRARLAALIKNAARHAQQGSPWPSPSNGVFW